MEGVAHPRDVTALSIAEAGALIHRGELSPVELAEAYLRRIERLDPRINAYLTVAADRALDDARRAAEELAAGRDRGPLHGVPIALKDLYDTAGIRTTGGAKIMADRVPEADSAAARRLREAGTVLLGKTNTHELARGATTVNPHFGPTRNPWDLARIPGGSSGGSGAAIAAALAAGTLGTDTGGSIRIPAALCGAVGLKPTYGRVSRAGILPLSWLLDTAGPITRTVEDAAVLLRAIAGYDPDDFATVPVPVGDYAAALTGDIEGLRVGVPRPYFFDHLDDAVRRAVEEALGVLRALGAEIREVELPGVAEVMAVGFGVTNAENRDIHDAAFRARPQDFGADVAASLARPLPDGLALAAALRQTHRATEGARRLLVEVDVLATPTTPIAATPIGQERIAYGGAESSVTDALIRCTAPFNFTRLPALSVPCGFTDDGLPIGFQLAGRPFDEASVLRVGHAYEQATDWHRRRPRDLE